MDLVGLLPSVAKGVWSYLRKTFSSEAQSQKLKHRNEWKRQFDMHLDDLVDRNVIIRHLSRMDQYPDFNDQSKSISSWFRAEFGGIYHRGFEVIIGIDAIKKTKTSGWILCRHDDPEAINALLIGRIPFDVVHDVDWAGDEFYADCHIYCEFPLRLHRAPFDIGREPYEELYYAKSGRLGDKSFYERLADYRLTQKLSKQNPLTK